MPSPDVLPLNETTLTHHGAQVDVPTYDRGGLRPSIVHIGVGGFHRAHLATYVDELARQGHTDWAILGSGVLASDVAMAAALDAQDHLYSLITRSASGSEVSVIGAMVDYLHVAADAAPLVARIADRATQVVSLTVTEGGYPIDDVSGAYDPTAAPTGPGSAFSIIAGGLDARRRAGLGPVTIVSCDNIMSNGLAARTATLGEAATIDGALVRWIEDNVTFPNSMVDRITPVTTDSDRQWLADTCGVSDRWPVVTEPFRQWVIEEHFAADAPPLADLGVILTPDVEPYEALKLRLLNASHSGLAYLSALLDIEFVHDAMADPSINRYVEAFLDDAATVLPPAPGIDLGAYRRSLVERFANPQIGDQIARLCLDGSAKFPKFLLPTIRAQRAVGKSPDLGALALAGWCHYLAGTTESGRAVVHASDPLLDQAIEYAMKARHEPRAFLAFSEVFDADLAVDPTFVGSFERALIDLQTVGVHAAVAATLGGRGPTG
ncbi:MAG: mannitol dehydrogenase family protein [Actinomycetota bacterium]